MLLRTYRYHRGSHPRAPDCVGTWKEIQVPQLHPDLLTQPFWEGIQQFVVTSPPREWDVGCLRCALDHDVPP